MGCPVQVERIICQQEAASSLSSLISKTWGLAWNLTKVKTCFCGKAPRFWKLLPRFKSTLTPPPHTPHPMTGISPQGVFVTGLHIRIHGCLEDSCTGVRREGRVQKGGQCSFLSMLLSGLDPTWTGLKPRPSEEPSPTFSPNPQQEGRLGPDTHCPQSSGFHFHLLILQRSLFARFLRTIFILKLLRACLVAQSCLALYDPVDHSPIGSSVRGILQARRLEWAAIFLLQGIFPNQSSNLHLLSVALVGEFFTTEPLVQYSITFTFHLFKIFHKKHYIF